MMAAVVLAPVAIQCFSRFLGSLLQIVQRFVGLIEFRAVEILQAIDASAVLEHGTLVNRKQLHPFLAHRSREYDMSAET